VRSRPTAARVPSIDVFRGALVVLLVVVEYLPPSPDWRWLRHSPWDGLRVADVVFPAFLFVVGASMAVGRDVRWTRNARRAGLLVALGLVFNAASDTSPLRYTGVLQTIGVAGLLAWVLIRIGRSPDAVAWCAGVLLLAHGALLTHSFAVDRWIFGDAHLYQRGAFGHDPEGVLNTVLGATAVVLLGWTVARTRSWLVAGALLAAGALAWLAWEPNKRAWTPTFALLVAGGCAVVLLARIDVPFLGAVGRNALLVYFGQHVVHELVLPQATGGTPHAQLAYAGVAAVAWSVGAVVLGRVGVRLRV
jgi:predicted acyltransferase